MRVIARRTLRVFWETAGHEDAEQPLRAWFAMARRATWRTPAELKTQFASASVLKDGRVVFNVAGNKYRLVVAIRYDIGVAFVRFVGTHREYDAIDAQEI